MPETPTSEVQHAMPLEPPPPQDTPEETLRVRLDWLIKLRKTTRQQVSLRAGKSYGVVRDLMSGKIKSGRKQTLESIVKVLHSDVDFLYGLHNHVAEVDEAQFRSVVLSVKRWRGASARKPRSGYRRMVVVGTARPGDFRAFPIMWDSEHTIEATPSKRFIEANHFALLMPNYRIMLDATALPTFALVAMPADEPVREGRRYVVLERQDYQGPATGTVEVAVRRAHFVEDGIELTAINADCPPARRVTKAPLDLDGDGSKPISILGIVYAIFVPLDDGEPEPE